MVFSKRTKFLLSSVVIPFLPVLVHWVGGVFIWGVLLALVAAAFAAYWSQGFDLKKHEFLLLPVPLWLVVLAFATVRISHHRLWFFWLGEGALLYLSFLTLNILNAATVRVVPLKKAALSTLYLLNLLTTGLVLAFTPVAWRFILLPFWAFVVAVTFLYYATERVRVWEGLVFGLLVGEIGLVSVFWPSQAILRSVFVAGEMFVLLGLLQHHYQHDLTKNLRREYLLISLILLVAFLLG